jgi:hypothetical protein
MDTKPLGLAALAVALACAPAAAGPADADLWIGLPASENGFLLDTSTGDAWMTGACLKPLERATRTGSVWVSRTVEFVSIGRAMTALDQTFGLDVNPAAPQITVLNPDRGGAHVLAAELEPACAASALCQARAAQPACPD